MTCLIALDPFGEAPEEGEFAISIAALLYSAKRTDLVLALYGRPMLLQFPASAEIKEVESGLTRLVDKISPSSAEAKAGGDFHAVLEKANRHYRAAFFLSPHDIWRRRNPRCPTVTLGAAFHGYKQRCPGGTILSLVNFMGDGGRIIHPPNKPDVVVYKEWSTEIEARLYDEIHGEGAFIAARKGKQKG